jgi:prevent-host-death family protein
MIKARISQLKNKLSYYLKRVQNGEELEILDRDRPVARIVRISGRERKGAASRLKEMEKEGLVQLGTGELSRLLLTKPPGKGARVLEAVLEDREDR